MNPFKWITEKRIAIRNWFNTHPGEALRVADTLFDATTNALLALLVLAAMGATVLSMYQGKGIDSLVYAGSSLILGAIKRFM